MSAPASSSAGLPEGARVVLATHNAGKVRELRQLLAGAVPGLDVEAAVVDAGAVGAPDVVEDGVTFAQNALKKARAVAAHTGLIAVADDSGLAVDVLHGAPGSSRPAGPGATGTTVPTSSCCWPSWPTCRTSIGVPSSCAPPRSRSPAARTPRAPGPSTSSTSSTAACPAPCCASPWGTAASATTRSCAPRAGTCPPRS